MTAYNTDGVASAFSNEVCIQVIENAIQACSEAVSPSPQTSSSGGGGGGSGGGCFVSTAGTDASLFSRGVARPIIKSLILAMLFSVVVLMAALKPGSNKNITA